MGDGKALQLGTSHELGQNFAKAFDISYSSAEGGRRARLDHLLGHLDPDARRADHVPRRRQRAAGAAEAGAGPGVRDGRQGRRGRRRGGGQAARRAARRRVSGSRSTTGPTPRSAAGPSTRSCAAIRYASRSAPATWPPATRWWCGVRTDRRPRRRWPTWSARCWPRWRPTSRRCTTRRWRCRRSRTVEVSTLAEAIEAAATGWAMVPWSAVGVAGEAEANGTGRDGPLPAARRRLRPGHRGRARPGGHPRPRLLRCKEGPPVNAFGRGGAPS